MTTVPASASLNTIQSFPLSARPTCPTILIPFESELYSLPVTRLDVTAEFHVATAFVKIVGLWKNIAIFPSDCMFVLPLNGTVTKASIRVKDRFFETVVLPRDSAQELQKEGAKSTKSKDNSTALPQQSDFESYIPNLFRLPIPSVASGEDIEVTVHYLEPLFYRDGKYHITFPLKFGSNLLADGKTFGDVISINCVVNAVTPATTFASTTHPIETINRDGTRIHTRVSKIEGKRPDAGSEEALSTDPSFLQSSDFSFSYSLSSEKVLCTLFKEEAKDDSHVEGTFALFVTPPSQQTELSSRDVVFLLDRSGSMTGDPFIEATRALSAALGQLHPSDRFNIVSFDHRQEYFKQELVHPTPAVIAEAASWVKSLQPERGGTDIQTPLQYALGELNKQTGPLPFVVLLTDGCVQNEREICAYAAAHAGNARVLTFGIGFFCNWFFLKMLAQIGRGFSDVVVYKERIYTQILELLDMASIPVLTNIVLKIDNLAALEMWPEPIPDLFMGAPLTVAGRFMGKMPSTVLVEGRYADGQPFTATVDVIESDVVPVSKVFLKQRIDLLTAKAWFKDSKQLQEQVVDISCTHSMPSAYTTMVAFETDEGRRQQLELMRSKDSFIGEPFVDADGKEVGLLPSSSSGGLPRSSSAPGNLSANRWYRNPKVIAGLAVGSAAVIGAVAFSFGDVASSIANVPVVGSFADAFHSVGDCGCAGCDCGGCDCGGCDLGGLAGTCSVA